MPSLELAPETAAGLLGLAREAIAAWLAGAREPELHVPGAEVHAGAFVTLYAKDDLRGCMGHVEADRPLARVVRKMAVAAARDDPRFPPLKPVELEALAIEISVLSAPEARGADDVVIGRDGLLVRRGTRQGVLLPQVAVEWSLDREGFLAMACKKAGLPRDAWKDERTTLMTFQAEVIGAPVA